jgi:hypothetical protein
MSCAMQHSIIKQLRILKKDIKVTLDSAILGINLVTFVKLNLSLYVITKIKKNHLCR